MITIVGGIMGIQPTNAGIDFQQRISAWFMIGMLFEIEVDNILSLNIRQPIKEITFESKDKIDDLVIKAANDKRIFLQMKRSISLSSNKDSEFFGVCQQFVAQFLQHSIDDLAYILVTSSNASSNITETLRRLLESLRTAKNFSIANELNNNEKEVLGKVSGIIREIYIENTGNQISENVLLELFNKIYVESFDIEAGQSYEKTIKMYLYNKTSIDVNLFWRAMANMALQLASNRQTLNKSYLNERFEAYLKKESENSRTDELLNVIVESDSLQIKMDYVLALENEEISSLFNVKETIKDANILFLIELYRFNENGKKKLKYEMPNFLTLTNGVKLEIVYRSATQQGLERFVTSEEFAEKFKDYSLIHIAANPSSDDNSFETAHESLLLEHLKTQKSALCLNCGKAIFQEETFLVEVDNDECITDAGMVHKECLLPVNRVLGIAKMPSTENYSFLNNFDINLWIKQIKDGQFCFNGAIKLSQAISPVVVETNDNFMLGGYCVKTLLEDGTYKYATRRGNIERYSKTEAEDFAKELNEKIDEAQKKNNPLCYSSISFTFGDYNNLVRMLGGDEECIECKKSLVVKYNESIAKLYNKCKNFYAPLIYLVVEEKPLVVNEVFPLFTNPLELQSYLENWNRVGINIQNYQVSIIKDDMELCLKAISLINQGIRPIVDMKLGKNRELIKGFILYTMDEMEFMYTMKNGLL